MIINVYDYILIHYLFKNKKEMTLFYKASKRSSELSSFPESYIYGSYCTKNKY